jgi:hypothetical protein
MLLPQYHQLSMATLPEYVEPFLVSTVVKSGPTTLPLTCTAHGPDAQLGKKDQGSCQVSPTSRLENFESYVSVKLPAVSVRLAGPEEFSTASYSGGVGVVTVSVLDGNERLAPRIAMTLNR